MSNNPEVAVVYTVPAAVVLVALIFFGFVSSCQKNQDTQKAARCIVVAAEDVRPEDLIRVCQ